MSRGRWIYPICSFVLVATPVAAQPSTEDGIRAMLRGDYGVAAGILTPAATRATKPDPVAQFFLAVLYDTGRGVRPDMGRACGLFLRAAREKHPLAMEAVAIATFKQRDLGPLCADDERLQGITPHASVQEPSDASGGPKGTADGVTALVRGDYPAAVQILEPLAKDRWRNDPAAQFFMAGLYETGRGVPADSLRACALYMRASSNFDHPFGPSAMTLLMPYLDRGAEFNEQCQLLSNLGFDHGFEPAVFHLGPGHVVEWRLTGATITYNGRIRRDSTPFGGFAGPGARFLPLRYTELATGPARTLTRHFIEMPIWEPAGKTGPWTLRWHVFEIVRDQIIRIDTPESLATVEGDAPPSDSAFDLREYAMLRVDGDGHAEWAVLKGGHGRSERIESDAERQEVREEALAHEAALKQVDWNRRPDVHREPDAAYVGAEGCGNIHIYAWTAGRDEIILIRIAAGDLGLSEGSATFDLSRQFANIAVETRVFDRPRRNFQFCSDVSGRFARETEPETWRATAGIITIELSAPGVRARMPHLRRAAVTLTGLTLRNAVGETVTVRQPLKLTAIVGGGFGG